MRHRIAIAFVAFLALALPAPVDSAPEPVESCDAAMICPICGGNFDDYREIIWAILDAKLRIVRTTIQP